MPASAEVLDFHPAQHAAPPTEAVLHELRTVRKLLSAIERRVIGEVTPPEKTKQPAARLTDDSIVDQRTAPVPKNLYLRLAREKAFPSRKIGKRIVAAWPDVRAAFLEGRGVCKAEPSANEQHASDNLDQLRRQLGLVEKG